MSLGCNLTEFAYCCDARLSKTEVCFLNIVARDVEMEPSDASDGVDNPTIKTPERTADRVTAFPKTPTPSRVCVFVEYTAPTLHKPLFPLITILQFDLVVQPAEAWISACESTQEGQPCENSRRDVMNIASTDLPASLGIVGCRANVTSPSGINVVAHRRMSRSWVGPYLPAESIYAS